MPATILPTWSDYFNGLPPGHPACQAVWVSMRRRFHVAARSDRPPLNQPRAVVGMLSPAEAIVLASLGGWPLSRRVRHWIASEPTTEAVA